MIIARSLTNICWEFNELVLSYHVHYTYIIIIIYLWVNHREKPASKKLHFNWAFAKTSIYWLKLIKYWMVSGKSGQIVRIQTNFFKLTAREKWSLIKYHVDFNPEEDRTSMRKILLRVHSRNFPGAHLFDGSTIFSIFPLCPEVSKVFVEIFDLMPQIYMLHIT